MNEQPLRHIGIIMDGNRRWAKGRGKKPQDGHLQGYKNLHDLGRYIFLEKKIPYLSVFAFSTENWKRTEEEVGYLMKLVVRALNDYLDEVYNDNIKVVILGSREKLSKDVLSAIETAEEKTKNNTAGTLAICFNYGGQQEIVDAAKKLIEAGTDPSHLDVESFAKKLYHPEIPPVDLVVRTSGEQRISNFMLWRAAYSELLFVDKHWPEITASDIDFVIEEFTKRQRRYGQ